MQQINYDSKDSTSPTEQTRSTNRDDRRESPERDKLRRMLLDFDDAMLVSMSGEHGLRARPMRILARHQEALDDLWFVSELDSTKVKELAREPRVAVVLGDHNRFISISGRARVVIDREKVDAMWTENWKLWFPEGTDKGDVALIQVVPEFAEYWDHASFKTVRVAFEIVRAWAKDERVQLPDDPDWHGSVSIR